MNKRISIDNLIEIVRTSGKIQTGVDVYNDNGILLLDKDKDDPNGILFYINPYHRGTILNRKDIDHFLERQKLERRPEYFIPCTNAVTIERMLRNLLFSYEKLGYTDKLIEVNQLIKIVQYK